jgi:hypothetical protein
MKDGHTLIWSFRNRIECLKRSVSTADETCPKNVDFYLVDGASDRDAIEELRAFCSTILDRRIKICESHFRTTCQQAWNLGIVLSDTAGCIFTSSDCYFLKPGWYEAIAEAQNLKGYVIVDNHSLFAITKKLVGKIGFFDEMYDHGMHVDVDYMIRASESNEVHAWIPNAGYYIHSDTPEEIDERVKGNLKDRLDMTSPYNENYFKHKWETSWPGFVGIPRALWKHPPTKITEVKRLSQEVCPYPVVQDKYRRLYV